MSSSCSAAQVGRRVHHDLHQQLAATAAVDVGHAAAPQPEDAAGLRARRDDEVLAAVERLVGDVDAEHGLGHRHVQHVQQVVALALEALVRAHPEVDVEVAGRRRHAGPPRRGP